VKLRPGRFARFVEVVGFELEAARFADFADSLVVAGSDFLTVLGSVPVAASGIVKAGSCIRGLLRSRTTGAKLLCPML